MTKILANYLNKQILNESFIKNTPEKDLQLVIIIPAFNEPDIIQTLNSLLKCYPAKNSSEVIILFNHSEDSPDYIKKINHQTNQNVITWIKQYSTARLKFYSVVAGNLPRKHAGAGLARKIAMDEAIRRFSYINNENGIIASLDADALVSTNYISEIQKNFSSDKNLNCTIFNFAHQINTELQDDNKKAIILYELYLHYYKQALKFIGFPYAFHTIGSCFAVKAATYAKQGGMNRKQAGEDFYFLHKIFPLGGTKELKQISVYPSARISDRVPFGTGSAIQKIIEDNNFMTYQPIYFQHLKNLFDSIKCLYNVNSDIINSVFESLHPSLQSFIGIDNFTKRLNEINGNCASKRTFIQRFYQWFDAFKIIKYLNHVHLTNTKISINNAATAFFKLKGINIANNINEWELLELFRKLDADIPNF